MKYTEDDMIEFALHFGIAYINNKLEDKPLPIAAEEFEVWKTQNGKS